MNHEEAWRYADQKSADIFKTAKDDDEAWIRLVKLAGEDPTLTEALQLIGFRKLLTQQQTRH